MVRICRFHAVHNKKISEQQNRKRIFASQSRISGVISLFAVINNIFTLPGNGNGISLIYENKVLLVSNIKIFSLPKERILTPFIPC
jgi:hypothetical protein